MKRPEWVGGAIAAVVIALVVAGGAWQGVGGGPLGCTPDLIPSAQQRVRAAAIAAEQSLDMPRAERCAAHEEVVAELERARPVFV